MNHARYSLGWLLLVVGVGVFAACLGRLPELSNTGQQPNVQVITAAPTGTVVLGTATVDPHVLTLTAYPPLLDTPTPSSGERQELPPPTVTPTPAKIVDLSAGSAPTETMVYIVQRADGSEEKWLVSATLLPSDSTYLQARNKLLKLGPQDRLIDAHPQALPPMLPGSSRDLPPLPTVPLTLTVTLTSPGQ